MVQFPFVPQINGGISHDVIHKRLFTRVPDLDEAWSISRYEQQRFHLIIFGWSKLKIEILYLRKNVQTYQELSIYIFISVTCVVDFHTFMARISVLLKTFIQIYSKRLVVIVSTKTCISTLQ